MEERLEPQKTRVPRAFLLSGGCLAAISGLAWAYLVHLSNTMPEMDMPGMAMPEPAEWGEWAFFTLFFMWAVMMIAMMVPSAAPMIWTFEGLNRRRAASQRALVPVTFFILGYVVIWTAYSGVATLIQWKLHKAALLSGEMAVSSRFAAGGVLLLAGIFQWTPLKHQCLSGCRSPLAFLMREWREGRQGAFVMGLRHGSYCLGCCWALMALLFAVGVMNLLWVAGLSAFVLVEKILPRGDFVARVAGILLAAGGIAKIAW